MLGDGRILVQRLGDILDGKRTWDKELRRSNVAPTLGDAVAGDITAAMPYRAMTNILAFMLAVDEVVPGFAAPETLLYSPELKFYSNRVKMDEGFRTSVRGLRCLGDSSGWTRGLMMASVMGYLAGRSLAETPRTGGNARVLHLHDTVRAGCMTKNQPFCTIAGRRATAHTAELFETDGDDSPRIGGVL